MAPIAYESLLRDDGKLSPEALLHPDAPFIRKELRVIFSQISVLRGLAGQKFENTENMFLLELIAWRCFSPEIQDFLDSRNCLSVVSISVPELE